VSRQKKRSIVVATANRGKLSEFIEILGAEHYTFFSLKEIGFDEEIDEAGESFQANAEIKCRAVARYLQKHPELIARPLTVLSDDSGLLVDALRGAPGIHTSRFAGPQATSHDNIAKMIELLEGERNRKAHFHCTICQIDIDQNGNSSEPQFSVGECHGTLATAPRGKEGFGYDPLFIPDGETRTFAEISSSEKKEYSHRGVALRQLRAKLKLA